MRWGQSVRLARHPTPRRPDWAAALAGPLLLLLRVLQQVLLLRLVVLHERAVGEGWGAVWRGGGVARWGALHQTVGGRLNRAWPPAQGQQQGLLVSCGLVAELVPWVRAESGGAVSTWCWLWVALWACHRG